MKKQITIWHTATRTFWGNVFLVTAALAALNLVKTLAEIL